MAATKWVTYDTDNISRSTGGGRASMAGTFKWRKQKGFQISENYRAEFAVTLRNDSARGSCAAFRVLTYQKDSADTPRVWLSKRFPKAGSTRFGYYMRCKTAKTNTWRLSGADEIWEYNRHPARADIAVCWTKNKNVAPSGNCYRFTVRPGDA